MIRQLIKKFMLGPCCALIFAVVLIALPSWAATFAVYYGGADNADASEPIFELDFERFVKAAKLAGWQTQYFYGGSQAYPTSFQKAQVLTDGKVHAFTTKNFLDSLSQYKSDIESGGMKSGDQLLLFISTHGPLIGGAEFSFMTVDGTAFALSNLKILKETAARAGVRLAIVAETCGSGEVQKLADEKTCVVTSSAIKKLGYNTDSRLLTWMFQLPEVINLEDAYFRARRAGTMISSQPAISTKAGQFAQKTLRPLNYFMDANTSIRELAEGYSLRRQCVGFSAPTFEAQMTKFQSDNESELHFALKPTAETAVERDNRLLAFQAIARSIEQLKGEMQTYFELRQDIEQAFNELNQKTCFGDPKVAQTCYRLPVGFPQYRRSLQEKVALAERNYRAFQADPVRKKINRQIFKASLEDLASFESTMQSKEYLKRKATYDHLTRDKLGQLDSIAVDVSRQERVLYDAIYQRASEASPQPNSCREFKLK